MNQENDKGVCMDELGQAGYFLLNVIMALILATGFWGIYALILFGIIMAPIGLITLFCLFFEAGTGFTPYRYILQKIS
jgi:hypothetical protein